MDELETESSFFSEDCNEFEEETSFVPGYNHLEADMDLLKEIPLEEM